MQSDDAPTCSIRALPPEESLPETRKMRRPFCLFGHRTQRTTEVHRRRVGLAEKDWLSSLLARTERRKIGGRVENQNSTPCTRLHMQEANRLAAKKTRTLSKERPQPSRAEILRKVMRQKRSASIKQLEKTMWEAARKQIEDVSDDTRRMMSRWENKIRGQERPRQPRRKTNNLLSDRAENTCPLRREKVGGENLRMGLKMGK